MDAPGAPGSAAPAATPPALPGHAEGPGKRRRGLALPREKLHVESPCRKRPRISSADDRVSVDSVVSQDNNLPTHASTAIEDDGIYKLADALCALLLLKDAGTNPNVRAVQETAVTTDEMVAVLRAKIGRPASSAVRQRVS